MVTFNFENLNFIKIANSCSTILQKRHHHHHINVLKSDILITQRNRKRNFAFQSFGDPEIKREASNSWLHFLSATELMSNSKARIAESDIVKFITDSPKVSRRTALHDKEDTLRSRKWLSKRRKSTYFIVSIATRVFILFINQLITIVKSQKSQIYRLKSEQNWNHQTIKRSADKSTKTIKFNLMKLSNYWSEKG